MGQVERLHLAIQHLEDICFEPRPNSDAVRRLVVGRLTLGRPQLTLSRKGDTLFMKELRNSTEIVYTPRVECSVGYGARTELIQAR